MARNEKSDRHVRITFFHSLTGMYRWERYDTISFPIYVLNSRTCKIIIIHKENFNVIFRCL